MIIGSVSSFPRVAAGHHIVPGRQSRREATARGRAGVGDNLPSLSDLSRPREARPGRKSGGPAADAWPGPTRPLWWSRPSPYRLVRRIEAHDHDLPPLPSPVPGIHRGRNGRETGRRHRARPIPAPQPAPKRPRVAVLASTYFYLSHAYHIVGRFLDGFAVHDGRDGRCTGPTSRSPACSSSRSPTRPTWAGPRRRSTASGSARRSPMR